MIYVCISYEQKHVQLHLRKHSRRTSKKKKKVATEILTSPEMRLAISLYIKGDYHCIIGEMAGIVQSKVCCIVIKASELMGRAC